MAAELGDADDISAGRAAAARALPLIDLTNLAEDCDAAAVAALCARARTPFGDVAALCLWPRFVAQARGLLGPGSPVRIATVVNFPSGEASPESAAAEALAALADGADEIDLVIPHRRLRAGDEAAVSEAIAAVRAACPGATLKAILETGELRDPGPIARASDLAIAAGADFLKTSTGKVAVNATPEAARVMLEAIRRSGRPVGFKAAGGIGTVEAAGRYLALADTALGVGWATPSTFRFGASGLLDAVLAALRGTAAAALRGTAAAALRGTAAAALRGTAAAALRGEAAAPPSGY